VCSLARLIALHAPHAVGGLIFFVFTAVAALGVIAGHVVAARTLTSAGVCALIPGVLLTGESPHAHSLLALSAGTALAGAGFGAVTQGVLRLILPPAAPDECAGTLAA
jgi:hypothetical protein